MLFLVAPSPSGLVAYLFLERVGAGDPKRMKRVIYEQTGHQDGVARSYGGVSGLVDKGRSRHMGKSI